MKKFWSFIKRLTLAGVMSCCLFATYIVVQHQKGESVHPEATKFLDDLSPHVNKAAADMTGYKGKFKKRKIAKK